MHTYSSLHLTTPSGYDYLFTNTVPVLVCKVTPMCDFMCGMHVQYVRVFVLEATTVMYKLRVLQERVNALWLFPILYSIHPLPPTHTHPHRMP